MGGESLLCCVLEHLVTRHSLAAVQHCMSVVDSAACGSGPCIEHSDCSRCRCQYRAVEWLGFVKQCLMCFLVSAESV